MSTEPYDLYERDHGGRADRLSTLAGDTARVSTVHLSPPHEEEEIQFLPQRHYSLRQNDRRCARDPFSTGAAFPASRDFGCRLRRQILRLRSGFRLQTPARQCLTHACKTSQVVKERSTSRLPLGARLESRRPRKVPGAPSLIPESHRDRT